MLPRRSKQKLELYVLLIGRLCSAGSSRDATSNSPVKHGRQAPPSQQFNPSQHWQEELQVASQIEYLQIYPDILNMTHLILMLLVANLVNTK